MKTTRKTMLLNALRPWGITDISFNNDEFNRINGAAFHKNGKKYFMKAAFGESTYGYASLLSESYVTKFLGSYTHSHRISHNTFQLKVPKVFAIIKKKQFICLITEYINGRMLKTHSIITKVQIINALAHCVSNISLNDDNNPELFSHLKSYSKMNLLYGVIPRLIKAIYLNPSYFIALLKLSTKIVSQAAHFNSRKSLVHIDINISNVLTRNKAVYLTDWEEAGYGHQMFNWASPLATHWNDLTFRASLMTVMPSGNKKESIIPYLAIRALMLLNQSVEKKSKKRIRDIAILHDIISNTI